MLLSTRRLFATVLLLSLFVLAVHEISDPDYWWHLRTGEYILQDNSVPHADIFSFTSSGKEWVAHEWLAELLMYSLYRVTGDGGVIVFFSAVIAAAFWITYRRCEGRPFVAGLAVFLGALAAAPTFGPRPQMFTLLLTGIFLAALESYSRTFDWRKLWHLAPLMLVWANLHAGFALGLGLIAISIVGTVLDGGNEGGPSPSLWRRARPLTVVLGACILVVLANPNGLRLYSYPLQTPMLHAMDYIEEWASPDFHEPGAKYLLAFFLATLGALSLSLKRMRFRELLLLLVSLGMALRSVRHVPILVLIATPLLVEHLMSWASGYRWSDWLHAPEKPTVHLKALFNTAVLLLLIAGGYLHLGRTLRGQKKNEGQRWPLAAVEFIRTTQPPQPIFNPYEWGGYLIWKLYPNYKVYIDGRNDLHGDALVEEWYKTSLGEGNWKEPLERRAIRTVIAIPNSTLSNLLLEDPSWRRAYQDTQAMIFVKSSQ